MAEKSWIPKSLTKDPKDLRNTFGEPNVLAQKLLKNPAITCSITIPVQQHTVTGTSVINTTIPFYMDSEFGFSLSNEFGDMVNLGGNMFQDLINGINLFTGKTQITLQSEAMSSQVWRGSSFGGFTVNCLFIATSRKINPVEIVRMLSAACLPANLLKGDQTTGTDYLDDAKDLVNMGIGGLGNVASLAAEGLKSVWSGATSAAETFQKAIGDASNKLQYLVDTVGMTAPLQYGLDWDEVEVDGKKIVKGVKPIDNTTLTLQIGDYFRADKLLMASISGIQFSKELIGPVVDQDQSAKDIYSIPNNGDEYGFPLYAKCTLNLKPCSMMTLDKFNGYFLNPRTKTTADKLWSIGQKILNLP